MSRLLRLSACGILFGTVGIAGCGKTVMATSSAVNASITLLPSPVTLITDQTVQLTALQITGDSTEDITETATWQSSANDSLAVSSGKATCSHAGVYILTVSTVALTQSATITCKAPVTAQPPAPPTPVTSTLTGITIVSAPGIVRSSTPVALSAQGTYADHSTSDVTNQALWKGDTIARIGTNGVLYCNNAGKTTVTATLGSYTATTQVQCLMKQITAAPGFVEHAVKFYGPFPSWLDVKTLGAIGDGVADDTNALQAGIIAALAQNKTLWIPRGTYKISDTLHIKNADGLSIVGEDPRSTQIIWNGAAGGTIISYEGSTRYRMNRLTLDGNHNLATVGIQLSYMSNIAGQLYPTYDELADLQIRMCTLGMKPMFAGETSVNRVHFDQNTYAINLDDWDALNFNVTDSLFTDNGTGVSNYAEAGGYNVSNSVFVRSKNTDMEVGNTQAFSIRHNLSVGSGAFFRDGPINSGAAVTLEGNVIVDTVNVPVIYGNQGTVILMNNTFEMPSNPQRPLLIAADWKTAFVLGVGNRYTTATPYQAQAGSFINVTSLDEAPLATMPASDWAVPTEVYVPPASTSPVVEVTAGGSGEDIQNAINEAAKVPGGATVHLPSSSYYVNTTIEVPDVPGLAIVGDGQTTDVRHGAMLLGPVFRTHGSVEMEGLFISGSSIDASLQMVVNDQPSTAVIVDQSTTVNTKTSMVVSGLDHATINTRATTLNGDWGVTLTGGSNQASGLQTLGKVNAFMTTSDTYKISRGGHFLISDGWHDGGQTPVQGFVSGNSVVTQEGGAIVVGSPTGVQAIGLTGQLSMVGTQVQTAVSADSASTGTIGMIGSNTGTGRQLSVVGSAVKVVHAGDTISNNGSDVLAVVDTPDADVDVERALSQTMTEFVIPRQPLVTPATRVRIHRVMVGDGLVGFSIVSNGTSGGGATYSIYDPSGSTAAPACTAGTMTLDGSWNLVSGGDGFYGLLNGSAFLTNTVSATDATAKLGVAASMTDAGQRWVIQPAGNGLFQLMNRADGGYLTRTSSGCGTVGPLTGDSSQEWAVAAK